MILWCEQILRELVHKRRQTCQRAACWKLMVFWFYGPDFFIPDNLMIYILWFFFPEYYGPEFFFLVFCISIPSIYISDFLFSQLLPFHTIIFWTNMAYQMYFHIQGTIASKLVFSYYFLFAQNHQCWVVICIQN